MRKLHSSKVPKEIRNWEKCSVPEETRNSKEPGGQSKASEGLALEIRGYFIEDFIGKNFGFYSDLGNTGGLHNWTCFEKSLCWLCRRKDYRRQGWKSGDGKIQQSSMWGVMGLELRCSTRLDDFHPFFRLLKPPAPFSVSSLSSSYLIKL